MDCGPSQSPRWSPTTARYPLRREAISEWTFFAISGYLIGALVYKEIRTRSFSVVKFYERRAKRILPALFGALVWTYLVGLALLSPLELQTLASSALCAITSSSNFFFMQSAGNY